MAGKGKPNKSGIPFPSKDPRYKQVWYLMQRRGKTLSEALILLPADSMTKGPVIQPVSQPIVSPPVEDDSINEMILDELCMIHSDLKRIEKLLIKATESKNGS